jgi:hypothetical protein
MSANGFLASLVNMECILPDPPIAVPSAKKVITQTDAMARIWMAADAIIKASLASIKGSFWLARSMLTKTMVTMDITRL